MKFRTNFTQTIIIKVISDSSKFSVGLGVGKSGSAKVRIASIFLTIVSYGFSVFKFHIFLSFHKLNKNTIS